VPGFCSQVPGDPDHSLRREAQVLIGQLIVVGSCFDRLTASRAGYSSGHPNAIDPISPPLVEAGGIAPPSDDLHSKGSAPSFVVATHTKQNYAAFSLSTSDADTLTSTDVSF
jgi:hypothetical protein